MENTSLISGIAVKEIADFCRGLLDEGLIFCSLSFILVF